MAPPLTYTARSKLLGKTGKRIPPQFTMPKDPPVAGCAVKVPKKNKGDPGSLKDWYGLGMWKSSSSRPKHTRQTLPPKPSTRRRSSSISWSAGLACPSAWPALWRYCTSGAGPLNPPVHQHQLDCKHVSRDWQFGRRRCPHDIGVEVEATLKSRCQFLMRGQRRLRVAELRRDVEVATVFIRNICTYRVLGFQGSANAHIAGARSAFQASGSRHEPSGLVFTGLASSAGDATLCDLPFTLERLGRIAVLWNHD